MCIDAAPCHTNTDPLIPRFTCRERERECVCVQGSHRSLACHPLRIMLIRGLVSAIVHCQSRPWTAVTDAACDHPCRKCRKSERERQRETEREANEEPEKVRHTDAVKAGPDAEQQRCGSEEYDDCRTSVLGLTVRIHRSKLRHEVLAVCAQVNKHEQASPVRLAN